VDSGKQTFGSEIGHSIAVRLMQHLVVPTFVLDAERRVTIWNHACERLTGIPAAEMIGTSDHWRGFYNEPRHCLADIIALDKSDQLAELYAAHTSPGEFGFGLRAENWCVMPIKGQRHYLAVDAGPIYDEQGKLIAIVETLRDMTDQKLAEMALQNLATKDSLTGLSNRRSLDEKLQLEWKCGQRTAGSLAFILADIDHFKHYNDHYGHQKGDECLRAVAGAIGAGVFRPADMAARYGGEEFAIIMPNTDLAGAQAVAERICSAVRSLEIPHATSATAAHVTLSLGVAAQVPDSGSNLEALITAADVALYRAKDSGRNRVIVAETT
jgi:diguanylate cyclase (GGDEF)-like protein/PAS domain S-box-containing protein